jgi:signal transduction histidine kinase
LSIPIDFFLARLGTHLWITFVAVAVMEGIAVYSWQFRKEPGARSLMCIQVCKATWLLSLLFASQSSEPDSYIFWMNLLMISSQLVIFFWFRFISQVSGFEREGPRWITAVLGGVVGVSCLIILTNHWHGWFWRFGGMEAGVPKLLDGPTNQPQMLVAELMSLFTLGLFARWVLRSAGLRQRQAWLMLIGSMISWLGHMLVSVHGSSVLAPLPSSFLLSSVIVSWAYFRWRIFSIVPLAKEVVVKTMIDGLMVLDESDRIVEMNPTAQAIFAGMPGTLVAAVAAWPALAGFHGEGCASTLEVSREVAGTPRFYHATQTPLRTSAGYRLGRVLVFKEVTTEKQQQALSLMGERQRLGRELHDGPGQIWSFLSMQAYAARKLIAKQNYAQADQRLVRLLEIVQGVHMGLRESITGLQASVSGEQGLLQALEQQLQWYREHCDLQAELVVRCECQTGMLSPSVEAQLLRIVQEALANVRKSAKASRVQVVVEREQDQLKILVEDDGCGFDPAQSEQRTGHHGLLMMRERADEIGALLTVDSRVGTGARIRLLVPIPAPALLPSQALL